MIFHVDTNANTYSRTQATWLYRAVKGKVFLEKRNHIPREKSVNCQSARLHTAEAELPKFGGRIPANLVRSPVRYGDIRG